MPRARPSLLALALFLAAPRASAQQSSVYLPPSAVLTNYDRVLIGQEEALESGAFVARVADSTAGWYNPAGLALVRRSVIGASATGLPSHRKDAFASSSSNLPKRTRPGFDAAEEQGKGLCPAIPV
jgi:hypothetical protein